MGLRRNQTQVGLVCLGNPIAQNQSGCDVQPVLLIDDGESEALTEYQRLKLDEEKQELAKNGISVTFLSWKSHLPTPWKYEIEEISEYSKSEVERFERMSEELHHVIDSKDEIVQFRIHLGVEFAAVADMKAFSESVLIVKEDGTVIDPEKDWVHPSLASFACIAGQCVDVNTRMEIANANSG